MIVVYRRQSSCIYCTHLDKIWPNIISKFEEIDPNIESYVIDEIFNNDIIPNDIKNYNQWFPMILLISKSEWEAGLNDENYILQNVKIFNGEKSNIGMIYNYKYDPRNPSSYNEWLSNSI